MEEIRRIAKERSGHVSLQAFQSATGITQRQILGTYWATWNEALAEAGVSTTSFFQPKVEERPIIEALAQFVERLKKWPSENELRMEKGRNSSFPSLHLIRRVSREASLASRIISFCGESPSLGNAAKIAAVRMEAEKAESLGLERKPVVGYVYMMKSGRRYKIGHTNSPSRRQREVRLDLPDPTEVVHTIETDDPTGIEAYWHKRFQAKRVRDTEFFQLDSSDVAAFKRRKYQ